MRNNLLYRRNQPNNRVDAIAALPLEPLEYCQKWVKTPHRERGARKHYISALAKATGLSPETIKNWGANFEKRPDYVLHTLRQADVINQIRKLTLPFDFPEE
ncbi:MAG: hypothetical protein WBB28_09495 [Crinalium sp.]